MDCAEVRKCVAAEQPWMSENVCRIHAHVRKFDWSQPPNKNNSASGTGTGFLLDSIPSDDEGVYVVTAHHVVAFAVNARVNFTAVDSEMYDAEVIGGNGELDVALLLVRNQALRARLAELGANGLQTGDSDSIIPPETVTAHGFALGQPHMQTTKGVVSGRIVGPSRLQTDVAVNPGNSGGPLLDASKRAIGVVTSGIADAQGINYVAPIHETGVVMRRVLDGYKRNRRFVPDRLPSFNATFVKSTRPLLNKLACKTGVYCCAVHPKVEFAQSAGEAGQMLADDAEALQALRQVGDMSVHTGDSWLRLFRTHVRGDDARHRALVDRVRRNGLREGDMVCAFTVRGKRYDIDMQRNARFDFWADAIGFDAVLDRLSMGDVVRFDIVRDGVAAVAEVALDANLNVYRKHHVDVEGMEYLVLAGVFVVPLAVDHLAFFKNQAQIVSLNALMARPSSRHASVLLVTTILPESSYNDGNTITSSDILVGINNHVVTDLYAARRAWEEEMAHADDHVITLRMRDGTIASATLSDIHASNRKIVDAYKSDEYVGHRRVPLHFGATAGGPHASATIDSPRM